MTRKKVDLTRLPKWQQYTISISVVTGIVALALTYGSVDNVPQWIEKYLMPLLVLVGLVVLGHNILTWFKKCFFKSSN